MAWSDNYRQAKFRNASFVVPSHDLSGGSRGAVHEFPKKDIPYVENMGKRVKQFSIEAFIIGDDYMIDRDALITELDKGSGKLVHPYYGTIDVFCQNYTVRETDTENGMVRFTIQFVQSGALTFPNTVIDTVKDVSVKKTAAITASKSAFAKVYSLLQVPFSVSQNAINTVDMGISAIETAKKSVSTASEYKRKLDTSKGKVIQLAYDALDLGQEIADIMTFGTNEEDSSSASADNALTQYNEMRDLWEFAPEDILVDDDPSMMFATFMQINSVINAMGLISLMEFKSLDDAIAIRDQVFAKLEELILDVTDDDLYVKLYDLQTSVSHDVDTRGADLARLGEYTLNNSLPAVVVSHDLYGNIDFEQDIIDRNKIEHPLFVPGCQTIEVLINE